MFSVIFEVQPHPSKWDTYLGIAKSLKPLLEQMPGFLRNIRYRSLRRDGWILSLSDWEDEKALVRWRTLEKHHAAQEKGREAVLVDYHLRVGQVAATATEGITTQRDDLTRTGDGAVVTLLETNFDAERVEKAEVMALVNELSLVTSAEGLLSWDVFDAVLCPGDVILLCTWRDEVVARQFLARVQGRDNLGIRTSCRLVRVIRDYGKYDRREAPQFYPDVPGQETLR
ncbi:putative enzyme [Coniochaeta sp. PMI_546]|nr:putative enzyme [Coniochaeta sp. PMI_546]